MKALFVSIVLLFVTSSYANAAGFKLGAWRIDTTVAEKPITSAQESASILYLPKSGVTFLSREAEPVSIKRIKKKIELHNGRPESLTVIRKKGYAIFKFETKGGDWVWYSTKGGYLQANVNAKQKAKLTDVANSISWVGNK